MNAQTLKDQLARNESHQEQIEAQLRDLQNDKAQLRDQIRSNRLKTELLRLDANVEGIKLWLSQVAAAYTSPEENSQRAKDAWRRDPLLTGCQPALQ